MQAEFRSSTLTYFEAKPEIERQLACCSPTLDCSVGFVVPDGTTEGTAEDVLAFTEISLRTVPKDGKHYSKVITGSTTALCVQAVRIDFIQCFQDGHGFVDLLRYAPRSRHPFGCHPI